MQVLLFVILTVATLNILLLLFNSTANGGLPGGSGTTIRHNTQKYTRHAK
jgi:hypothetical protein